MLGKVSNDCQKCSDVFKRYSLIFGNVRVIFGSARKRFYFLLLSRKSSGELRPSSKYRGLPLVVKSTFVLTSDIFVVIKFALVIHENCFPFNQSESSNLFSCIIILRLSCAFSLFYNNNNRSLKQFWYCVKLLCTQIRLASKRSFSRSHATIVPLWRQLNDWPMSVKKWCSFSFSFDLQ